MSKKVPSGRPLRLLHRLYEQGYIRIGSGFIDVTEKDLNALGVSPNPVFGFIKVSPPKREKSERITNFPVQRVLMVAGDMERERLGKALRNLLQLKGIQDTKSNITFQSLK